MAEFAIPIGQCIQNDSPIESAEVQEVPAAPEDAQAPSEVLTPVGLLHLFCQNPPSIDCLPSKKGMQLAEETAKLHRALKFFLSTNRAEPLLAELNGEKLDITILYFAARLWGNPETGMEVCRKLETNPQKTSAGKFLHSLLKPLNAKAGFHFWSSLGETPPMQAAGKMKISHAKNPPKPPNKGVRLKAV
jgi:hypothetical protein